MEINKTKREDLKKYFKKYEIPTEGQFQQVFDAMISQADDGIAKLSGQPFSIEAQGANENLISFYKNFNDETPTWILSQNFDEKPGFNFSEASGVSRLFIKNGTGEIGVNTKLPLKKLHVEKGEFRVRSSHNNAVADIGVFMAENLTQGIGIGYNRIEAVGNNDDQDILIMPKNNGKVGINTTTSPAAMLFVEGDAIVTDHITLKDGSNAGDTLVKLYNSADDGVLDVYQNNVVKNRIHGNGNTWFTGGNVGIGTTSPNTELEVIGLARAGQSQSEYTEMGHGGANGYINTVGDGNLDFRHDGNDKMSITSDGKIGIGISSPLQHLHVKSGDLNTHLMLEGNTGTWDFEAGSSLSVRSFANNAYTARMVIDNAGNMGIGGTDPGGDRLKVWGTGNFTGGIKLNNVLVTATAGDINKLDGYTGTTTKLNYTAVTPGTLTANKAIVVNGSKKIDNLKVDNIDINGNTIKATDANGLNLYNNSNQGIEIQNGGDIVIPGASLSLGTAASNSTLYIGNDTGDQDIKLDGASSKVRILAYGQDQNAYFQVGKAWQGGSTADLHFGGIYGSPMHMTIKANGRIGIGTTNPAGTLDVARGTASDGTAVFRGTDRITHFNYSTSEHTYIRGGKANSNVLINDNGGNVGIGTTAPAAKLQVVGGTARIGDSLSNYTEIGHGGSNGYINRVGAGNLDFRIGGSDKMSIASNGSVSIPGSLSVSGSMGGQNKNQNGYQKLGNIMIQWGYTKSNEDGVQYFGFPVAFKTACWSVVNTVKSDNFSLYMPLHAVSKNGFEIDRNNNVDGEKWFYWIAIGDC